MKKFIISVLLLFILTPVMAAAIDLQQSQTYDDNFTYIINKEQQCFECYRNKEIIRIYDILNQAIPSNIYLTYFMATNNGKIDIKGCTDNVENVYIFFKNLKDSLIGYQLNITKLDLSTYCTLDVYEKKKE